MTRPLDESLNQAHELLEVTPEVIPIVIDVLREYIRATSLHPHWPADPIYASAILNEEAGELTKAALQYVEEEGDFFAMKQEAIHTGAMAIRFLVNHSSYRKNQCRE